MYFESLKRTTYTRTLVPVKKKILMMVGKTKIKIVDKLRPLPHPLVVLARDIYAVGIML